MHRRRGRRPRPTFETYGRRSSATKDGCKCLTGKCSRFPPTWELSRRGRPGYSRAYPMNPLFALFETLSWWGNLTTAQQFFYGIGIFAGVVTVVLAILTLVGLGHHDADFSGHDAGTDHGH